MSPVLFANRRVSWLMPAGKPVGGELSLVAVMCCICPYPTNAETRLAKRRVDSLEEKSNSKRRAKKGWMWDQWKTLKGSLGTPNLTRVGWWVGCKPFATVCRTSTALPGRFILGMAGLSEWWIHLIPAEILSCWLFTVRGLPERQVASGRFVFWFHKFV